jgi:hypothetical protein
MAGQFASEWLVSLQRNQWSVCSGIRTPPAIIKLLQIHSVVPDNFFMGNSDKFFSFFEGLLLLIIPLESSTPSSVFSAGTNKRDGPALP